MSQQIKIEMSQSAIDKINALRKKNGLRPLKPEEALRYVERSLAAKQTQSK